LFAGATPGARAAGPASSDVRPTPEAERTLGRVVLGLDPNQTKLFLLPETVAWDPKSRDPRVRWLRRELCWLRFELGHGQMFRRARPYTVFFIAVPNPRTTANSLGGDEAGLRDYLKEHVGWTDRVIAERVRFFAVPEQVPYPQDMAEPIGYDASGRLVLGVGDDIEPWYRHAVDGLVAAFPKDFAIRPLPDVNTEGGDLSIVRLPDGGVGLLVGSNRIARFVARRHPETTKGAPIPDARIEEARRAYQEAFDGVETIVVGHEALRNPLLGNAELYHIDMLVAVLLTPSGVVAFVPTYGAGPIDAHSHVAIPIADVRRFQAEYDRTARQFEARGYRVARVPFADHPARSPVGITRFAEAQTGRSAVMLGRYPDHAATPDGHNSQSQVQGVLRALEESVAAWQSGPTDARWRAVHAAVDRAWKQMDASAEQPNPDFERQKKIYESYGVSVMGIPIFPTGEGGVHCLVLK
jgi:hypothetical protein